MIVSSIVQKSSKCGSLFVIDSLSIWSLSFLILETMLLFERNSVVKLGVEQHMRKSSESFSCWVSLSLGFFNISL